MKLKKRMSKRLFQRQLRVCPKRVNVVQKRPVACRLLRQRIKRVFKKRRYDRTTSHVRRRIRKEINRKKYKIKELQVREKMSKRRFVSYAQLRREKRRVKRSHIQHGEARAATIRNCRYKL